MDLYIHFPYISSWRGQGKLYLIYVYIYIHTIYTHVPDKVFPVYATKACKGSRFIAILMGSQIPEAGRHGN